MSKRTKKPKLPVASPLVQAHMREAGVSLMEWALRDAPRVGVSWKQVAGAVFAATSCVAWSVFEGLRGDGVALALSVGVLLLCGVLPVIIQRKTAPWTVPLSLFVGLSLMATGQLSMLVFLPVVLVGWRALSHVRRVLVQGVLLAWGAGVYAVCAASWGAGWDADGPMTVLTLVTCCALGAVLFRVAPPRLPWVRVRKRDLTATAQSLPAVDGGMDVASLGECVEGGVLKNRSHQYAAKKLGLSQDVARRLDGLWGERATAVWLASLPAGRVSILHDVSVPGLDQANCDHLLVWRADGRVRMTVVDSKVFRGSTIMTRNGVITLTDSRGRDRTLEKELSAVHRTVYLIGQEFPGVEVRGMMVVHGSGIAAPHNVVARDTQIVTPQQLREIIVRQAERPVGVRAVAEKVAHVIGNAGGKSPAVERSLGLWGRAPVANVVPVDGFVSAREASPRYGPGNAVELAEPMPVTVPRVSVGDYVTVAHLSEAGVSEMVVEATTTLTCNGPDTPSYFMGRHNGHEAQYQESSIINVTKRGKSA